MFQRANFIVEGITHIKNSNNGRNLRITRLATGAKGINFSFVMCNNNFQLGSIRYQVSDSKEQIAHNRKQVREKKQQIASNI